jgi:hypothetical protein
MSSKFERQQATMERERKRRRAADQRRIERDQAAEHAATEAGVARPALLPPVDPRPNPAVHSSTQGTAATGSGRRTPGQQVGCGWCGQPVQIRSRGPIPKWCSPTCRHRAWEQTRAARSGLSAVEVLDRYVAAVPENGPDWIHHLTTLANQINTGTRPIADHDLDGIAAALEIAQAAIADRTRWRGSPHYS